MIILEKSYNSATTIPIDSKLFEMGHIFIENEITSESADAIKKQIMYLVCESADKSIYIHINSPGGDINAGLVLYDIIQDYSDRIYLVCTGRACSMAAVLLACGKMGHRFILQNSEAMIHEPLISNQISGNCSSIKATSMRLVDIKEKMNKILANHTGKSLQEIDEATSFDNYLNAQEAVKFGLADRIISFKDIMEGNVNG
ncbi:ATP-dependent Clp protease proteolytic subunit [uncultured Eubacterium sp.]|uniref:ATP-dependent Clp protease proteolytic subunit n=1 Tax=uncultured Eubacterium sp. TaxID=165185 RepID=UPI0025D499E0|nr:ATP-dependent Clp protease proteolytic subunit [uncultured Eubacterium sp.]